MVTGAPALTVVSGGSKASVSPVALAIVTAWPLDAAPLASPHATARLATTRSREPATAEAADRAPA